jgi:hypothetical protein
MSACRLKAAALVVAWRQAGDDPKPTLAFDASIGRTKITLLFNVTETLELLADRIRYVVLTDW